MGYQTANVVELLKRCAAIFEPHGLVMVLEPLNWHANHGGVFLERSDQAYSLCKAVDSPACKILFDIYHQQITEGNLIKNIDLCWDEIGYFQIGDNPGRKEPGTGEINYRNIFKHVHARMKAEGRNFIFGMEHGNSIQGAEGETAVAAHRNKFGTECLSPDQQTKAKPAELGAVDYDVWLWQYACMESRVWSDGGGRR